MKGLMRSIVYPVEIPDHLDDSLSNQLQRCQAEGNLESQARQLSPELIEEYRRKFNIPW